MNKILALVVFSLLIASCSNDNDNIVNPPARFAVKITDPAGIAVPNVRLVGGIDWTSYAVTTDSNGIAQMPSSAKRQRTTVSADNFVPMIIYSLEPQTYIIQPTPKRLIAIGEVQGNAIIFDNSQIITVDYGGRLRVYNFSDEQVTLQSESQVASTAKKTVVKGDTLWISTHESGIYAHSISNPAQPIELLHLDIAGYLGPFDVKDSLIVVASPYDPGSIKSYIWTASSEYRLISELREFFVTDMQFVDDALVILGNRNDLPTIFDFSDPFNPKFVFRGYSFEVESGLFAQSDVLLKGTYANALGYREYQLVSLADPFSPVRSNTFPVEGTIGRIFSSSSAVGSPYFDNSSAAIFERNNTGRFTAVAVMAGAGYGGNGGARPPYYILAGRLVKVVNRQ